MPGKRAKTEPVERLEIDLVHFVDFPSPESEYSP
jgi:hypothetical protein